MALPIELPFGRMLLHLLDKKDDEAFIPNYSEFSGAQPVIGWQRFDGTNHWRLRRVWLSESFWTISIDNAGILPMQIPANISTYGELRKWCAEQIRLSNKDTTARETLKHRLEQIERQLLAVRRQLDFVA